MHQPVREHILLRLAWLVTDTAHHLQDLCNYDVVMAPNQEAAFRSIVNELRNTLGKYHPTICVPEVWCCRDVVSTEMSVMQRSLQSVRGREGNDSQSSRRPGVSQTKVLGLLPVHVTAKYCCHKRGELFNELKV